MARATATAYDRGRGAGGSGEWQAQTTWRRTNRGSTANPHTENPKD